MASASTPQDPNATIAELRRANAALQQERDAALVREVALAEVLEIINRSPGDPAPVFEAILEKAHRLCGADLGSLTSYDGDFFHAVATRGYPPEVVELLALQRHTARAATPPQRLLAGERFVNIPDLSLEEGRDDNPVLRGLVEHGHVRTNLLVPLRKGDALLGYIAAARREVRPFSEAEVALLESFAAQAVIAMENARLLTEQQEALERQTATAEVLQVINASPGDLTPVFDAILRNALRLCQATFGEFHVQVGESSLVPAVVGVPADYAAFCATYSFPPNPGTIAARLNAGEPFVHIPDLMDTDAYRANDPGRRAMVELGGARSVVAMAMRRDGRYCGAIVIFRSEPGPFSERLIALLRNFAAQAEIAMENARLLNELRDRTDELAARNTAFAEQIDHQSATIDVLKAMSASPGDPQPVFDLIAVRARDVCQAYGVTVCEYDGALIHWRANTGLSDDPAVVERFKAQFPAPPTPDTIFGRTVVNRDVVHIRDLAGDPRIDQARRGGSGARSSVGVPLLRDGAVIGALVMGNRALGGFSDSQVQLLQTFAEQAVIAIRSAETYSALEARTAALAQRNSEFGERIDQQAATIEVLKVMSASPDDTQPVFDQIVRRARELCNGLSASLFQYDGELVEFRAICTTTMMSIAELAASRPEAAAFVALWPMAPSRDFIVGRAILERDIIHVRDVGTLPGLHQAVRNLVGRSVLAIPLLRDGTAVGAIVLNAVEPGGFTDSQVELLKTFAEQAMIAIGNVATYRQLRERTAELGVSLEQQTATAKVLEVISRSAFDLDAVFATLVHSMRVLVEAEQCMLVLSDGETLRSVKQEGWPPAFEELVAAGVPIDYYSGAGRSLMLGEVVHFPDVLDDPDYRFSRGQQLAGYRAILAVPLLRDSRAIGAFSLGRPVPKPFTPRQIELVKTFADQALIAIENARLFDELRERTTELDARNRAFAVQVDHQAATIDVLKVMSSATSDTQPVFDIILRRAVALSGAKTGGIFRLVGGLLHEWAGVGFDPAALAAYRQAFPAPATEGGVMGRAILQRRTMYARDYHAENPDAWSTVRGLGYNSLVAVPLLRDGVAIGVLTVQHEQVDAFSPEHIALLETFAEQAVIAIGSVATFRELQQRTADLTRSVAELQALEEVLRAVNSSLDLETVLATIISRAVQLSQSDEGTIYEFDAADEVFVPKSAFGMTEERIARVRERRIRMGETHVGRSAELRAPVQVDDVQNDPGVPEAATVLAGIHAVLAVPLLREENVVGGLVIRRRTEGAFAPATVALMQTFAAQSVLAIENARLFEAARRARAASDAALADLRRAQDRLVQTEKMASLGQLTAGIAHEIKNPLNFVNNFSELSTELIDELREALAPAPIDKKLRGEIDDLTGLLRSNLEKVVQHGKRADGIVKNMLLHSRESGGEQRRVEVNTIVEEALNLAYHGARAEKPGFNISLVRKFDPAAGALELYPQEFTRVLLNLISNGFYAAIRKQADGGDPTFEPTLTVATEARPGEIAIRVRDNGIGIPDAVRAKMFEPFFTTKPAGEGTGLGLSLSHDIVVKQHGGSIVVDTSLGAFTEFTVTLPRPAAP